VTAVPGGSKYQPLVLAPEHRSERLSGSLGLVLSLAPVGEEMTGPAIRAYELARVLAANGADINLAATAVEGSALDVSCVSFDRHDGRSLQEHLRGVDFVIAQPQWPLVMRTLRRSAARLVFDLYDPEPLETLEHHSSSRAPVRRLISAITIDRLVEALRIGNHFLCASENQRDLWLGSMLAERLIRPDSYDRDPSFRSVISTVPFGVPDAPPPERHGHPIRERFPAIGPGDEVVLWNGGIWSWLDPATAIRAVGSLSERRPELKLVFMGASSRAAGRRSAEAAYEEASRLGLLDRVVMFSDRWVPYSERANWLREADCAVSCHFSHLEAQFAFRTRILDCFWAGLPVVCTEGDALAAEVARHELGIVVPEQDAAALASGLEQVLDRGRASYGEALAEAAERHRWSHVTAPLLRVIEAAEIPQPLGAGSPPRPGQRLRNRSYVAIRSMLNAAGVKGWPGLRSQRP
jgi:glycosyltransferase involved in cell wall biosynthesis